MQVYKRLPDVEKIEPVSNAAQNPDVAIINGKLKDTEIALSFLLQKIKEAKEETRSEIVKSYESRITELRSQLDMYKKKAEEYKQALIQIDSKSGRGNDAILEKLNKKIISQENQIKAYKKSYEDYYSLSKKLASINQSIEAENNLLKGDIGEYARRLGEQEEKYSLRLEKLRNMYEAELKSALSDHLKKEIDANTRIDFLKSQIEKLHALLRSEKERQKEIADSLQKLSYSIEGKDFIEENKEPRNN